MRGAQQRKAGLTPRRRVRVQLAARSGRPSLVAQVLVCAADAVGALSLRRCLFFACAHRVRVVGRPEAQATGWGLTTCKKTDRTN